MSAPVRILSLAIALAALAGGCGDSFRRTSTREIVSFSFTSAANPGLPADVVATQNGAAISATLPFGTNVTALVATFDTTGASVSIDGVPQTSGQTANNFSVPQTYHVVAPDTSTRDYIVTVKVAASPAKALTAFAFLMAKNAGLTADVVATITGNAVTATVPFGTDVTRLVATFSLTGASVSVGSTAQVSGTTANNFTNPVTYRVKAADTTTADYVVTISVAPSTAKAITAYSFTMANNAGLPADVIATINGTAIAATVPFGTDVTGLIATFTTTGASVTVGGTAQVSGTTPNDFTAPVDYKVTAADTSTQTFTVTVTVAANPAKDLTSYQFLKANNAGLPADVTATISGTTITASVPIGTDVTGLIASFVTTGASVKVGANAQVSGTTPNDFTAAVVYRVTALDATTKDYTVTVTAQ